MIHSLIPIIGDGIVPVREFRSFQDRRIEERMEPKNLDSFQQWKEERRQRVERYEQIIKDGGQIFE